MRRDYHQVSSPPWLELRGYQPLRQGKLPTRNRNAVEAAITGSKGSTFALDITRGDARANHPRLPVPLVLLAKPFVGRLRRR